MESLYLLIPVSLLLVAVIAWLFFWAIRSGQFDDLEGPAYRILFDDDDTRPQPTQAEDRSTIKETVANARSRHDGAGADHRIRPEDDAKG